MKDKDKLKKLVEIIGDLLKIEGNEWLIDEILKTIGENSPIEEIAKHSVIQNIHEYCVEQKIEKQANEFYQSFPIEEIKDQLIQDYKKMEHERRRDDFENFCLSMYQQIENITNYLFEKYILKKWDSSKNNIAYKFPDGRTLFVKDIVFGKANDWFANVKFKAVLFYFYFSEKIKVIIPFNNIVSVFDELYQMRNQNHRGNNPSGFQKNTLDKIIGNEAKYYFKFYGFLQDFVNQIEQSFGEKDVAIKINPNKIQEVKNKLKESPKLKKLVKSLSQFEENPNLDSPKRIKDVDLIKEIIEEEKKQQR